MMQNTKGAEIDCFFTGANGGNGENGDVREVVLRSICSLRCLCYLL
jgi:hypothetical protein